jgi:class 3 adenylate cyclase
MVCTGCGHENSNTAKFCEACGAALGGVPGERRKVVSVLFCDVVGSTALGGSTDPEALRALLARYFDQMKAIVEGHGGSVEKFIGDAVMAVFGVPAVHEDDALRACRAATEMREAFPALGIAGRIGVSTGEVVTGTAERLATGDALNVAARLQQVAAPAEVLISAATRVLAGAAVDVEAVEPLTVKGKREPLTVFRLVGARESAERPHDTVFVGRDHELTLLAEAWKQALAERRCRLATIVGDAGLGKSRLAAEALASIQARILRGRCLPYGAGITYWPVVEVVRQLDALPSDPAASAALRALLGDSEVETSAEDIAWAFRKLIEEQAPLVVLFDDIQWGEARFLDLVEHVALLSSDAPILLLCLARPELLDSRPSWPVAVRLEPLSGPDAVRLIGTGVSGELRTKIAAAAGGNPLFIREMLTMAGETGGAVAVPPTLKALLAARLDQLDPAERRVLECAAVEGEVFHRGAVQALAPEEPQVTPRLAALARRELISPERPVLTGEDGFRFRHLLIRDAAYEALPKTTRVELHARFASWLEQHGPEVVELDELLGYHLELAFGYRTELGLSRDDTLAAAARSRLAAGGQRAALRQDYGSAVSLFERAAALVPPAEVDLALEAELMDALFWTGRGDDAVRRADALAERASALGDRIGELCGRIHGSALRLPLEREGATAKLDTLLDEALPVFMAAGDDLALYIAYSALASLEGLRARNDDALEASERAFAHARLAGHRPPMLLASRSAFRFFGTTPAPELLTWLDDNEPPVGRDHFLRAYRAATLAMLGRFDEARTILVEERAELADRGGGVLLANITAFESAAIERWAGDPAAAIEFGTRGWSLYHELGETGYLAGAAGDLAHAHYALDQLDEADAWAARAAELGTSDDAWKETVWRQVRAKVLARRSDHAQAEQLAREAVSIADETQMLNAQADAYADLAEVLLLGGDLEKAAAALEEAHMRYERKGNLVFADRTRARLAELRGAASR